jgi:hypothetical protein
MVLFPEVVFQDAWPQRRQRDGWPAVERVKKYDAGADRGVRESG